MLKPKSEKVSAGAVPTLSKDSVRINAGSFIIDNTWISFTGTIFKVKDYISSVVVGSRTRFFKDRNYAVYLLVCLDLNEGVTVIEGKHVLFTTLKAVPAPESFSALPLIGLILIQDGTRDLVYGFKPVKDENLIYFSATGNIIDKDVKGVVGEDSTTYGETGRRGETGIVGYRGITGRQGLTGYIGPTIGLVRGDTGLRGMTGINWDIYVPFDVLL